MLLTKYEISSIYGLQQNDLYCSFHHIGHVIRELVSPEERPFLDTSGIT